MTADRLARLPGAYNGEMPPMEQSTRRCDNLACICDIPFAQATCGDHCAGAKPEEIRCECGHSK